MEEAYKDHSKGFKKINSTAPRVEIVEAYKQGEKDGKSVDFTKRTIQA